MLSTAIFAWCASSLSRGLLSSELLPTG